MTRSAILTLVMTSVAFAGHTVDVAAQSGDPLGVVRDSANPWLQAGCRPVVVVRAGARQKSAETEMAAVAGFLARAQPAEAPYLRFFTFYGLPDDPAFTIGLGGRDVQIGLRQAGLLTLSFVLNSTAHVQRSQGAIVTPTMVPGSSTLAYINLEDYGWTADQWERISRVDPYLSGAMLDQQGLATRYHVAGNLLFRGDWFIAHATDAQRQADAKIAELIYYDLLYDQQPPKNGAEFRKALGIDAESAIRNNLDRRVIMEAGKSSVSIATGGNRKIQGIRTPSGYYWETFDTKALDYLNNLELDDKLKDAGELIASHKNGTQVYLLVNQDDARVDFADNGLVEDTNPLGKRTTRPIDRRVRTAASCMVCHAAGLNPVSNSVAESLRVGVELNVLVHPDRQQYAGYREFREARERYRRLDRRYINNGIDEAIAADNRIFESAVRQCNGLQPSQNAYLLWAVRQWYDDPVTLTRAAVECGVSSAQYVENTRGSISARVSRIVASDKFAIPRRYWESLDPPGDYAHSVLTIRLHDPAKVRTAVQKVYRQPVATVVTPQSSTPPGNVPTGHIRAIGLTPVLVTVDGRETTIGTLSPGQMVPHSSFDGTWYQITMDGRVGFVRGANVEVGR